MILRCVQNNICRRRGLQRRLFSSRTMTYDKFQDDLYNAMMHVKNHDPAAFLPGWLLPQPLQITYFAVRSFWIETGLQFGRTTKIPANSTPQEHLLWFQTEIDSIYNSNSSSNNQESSTNAHSTIRLLHHLNHKHNFRKENFDNILNGRKRDLELRDLESNQYQTMADLEQHALLSCSSLLNLVLESHHNNNSNANNTNNNSYSPSAIDEAIKKVGICHGLTNALRLSIPTLSTTGKLVIPQDLCTKYGIKSPRYSMSALGQGDANEIAAMSSAVAEIVQTARDRLAEARELRNEILQEGSPTEILLPAIVSETFLDRLESNGFQLTNRNLRNVNLAEHLRCGARTILAAYRNEY